MNLVVGGLSLSGEDKDAVKKNVLSILMKEYGMSEEDFLSAELEVVPALKARDVGFDRAFVAGYVTTTEFALIPKSPQPSTQQPTERL